MNPHILIAQIQQLRFYQLASLTHFSLFLPSFTPSFPFLLFFFSYSFSFGLKYLNQIPALRNLPLFTPAWISNKAICKQNQVVIITLNRINSNSLLLSNAQHIFSFP